MSEHTCGTCGNVSPGEIVCRYIDEDGCEMCDTVNTGDAACRQWVERGDSLEQIALDAINYASGGYMPADACIICNAEHGGKSPCASTPRDMSEECCIPYTRQILIHRLRAQGVEVTQ